MLKTVSITKENATTIQSNPINELIIKKHFGSPEFDIHPQSRIATGENCSGANLQKFNLPPRFPLNFKFENVPFFYSVLSFL